MRETNSRRGVTEALLSSLRRRRSSRQPSSRLHAAYRRQHARPHPLPRRTYGDTGRGWYNAVFEVAGVVYMTQRSRRACSNDMQERLFFANHTRHQSSTAVQLNGAPTNCPPSRAAKQFIARRAAAPVAAAHSLALAPRHLADCRPPPGTSIQTGTAALARQRPFRSPATRTGRA